VVARHGEIRSRVAKAANVSTAPTPTWPWSLSPSTTGPGSSRGPAVRLPECPV